MISSVTTLTLCVMKVKLMLVQCQDTVPAVDHAKHVSYPAEHNDVHAKALFTLIVIQSFKLKRNWHDADFVKHVSALLR